ncbi:MAG: hypothetical protein QOH93_1878, partial [Chloroflexia bacterium]|nr:hypothetical protein [Chloroflexia bacterium]
MRKRGCIWLSAGFVVLAVACSSLVLYTSDLGGCSLWNGTCDYDPRVQHPPPLFIEQPPEGAVVRYIEDQAKLHGTFPSNAGYPVTYITPVEVSAWGFLADWHVVANVRVAVHHRNGVSNTLQFELMERTSAPLPLVENSTMHTAFGPIRDC